MSLEFMRRLSKEYDRYILRQFRRQRGSPLALSSGSGVKGSRTDSQDGDEVMVSERVVERRFRPSVVQQLVRALLHMVQFGVAYFVMLLVMYYNGYIIVCILIGAFIGSFVFGWESLSAGYV